MRKVILAIVLFCLIIPIQAQYNHQLGVNVSTFVKQFLVFNSNNLPEANPYLVTYRHMGKKWNWRAGLGGNYRFDNTDNQASKVYSESDTRKLNFRTGLDKTIPVSPKWNIYLGADLFTLQSNEKTYSRFTNSGGFTTHSNIKRRESWYGIAPNTGIEWRFNSRISLYTEMYLQCYRRMSSEKTWSVNSQGISSTPNQNFINSGNISFTMPVSVFFNVLL
ncbi:MAG: hypothetical protein JNL57_09465 [Bacteroidetes bacterium]|nr:hypothetical protein [Bacteroidota bacterium]